MAIALDACFGEPPPMLHPVVWMGRCLEALERRAPGGDRGRLVYGAAMAVVGPLAWGGIGWVIERVAPWPVCALALKPTFAGRALLVAAGRVEADLRAGRLEDGRRDLQWLVSRPTADLDPGLVAAAAIESVAENLVDSWAAPLLLYACFGLPGAFAYRAVNTADAMWGYRTPIYEHLGKAAARLDDLANLIPARLGAAVLVCVGPRPLAAFDGWRRDAGRTDSPNAGQTMAVIAGHLDARLEKPGAYRLNADTAPPTAADLQRARGIVARAMVVTAALAVWVGWVRHGR